MSDVEDKMDRALRFLAETDGEYASRRAMMMRCEYMLDVAECMVYNSLEGTVEDRKRAAKSSPEVGKAMEEYLTAVKEYEFLKARRKRAELTFEMCRTLEASRRMGSVR